MGILNKILGRKYESSFTFDFDFITDESKRVYMKKLAIETCISFLGRTISQTEFRVKEHDEHVKNDLYYLLNVRPNLNQTASTFWQNFIRKLVYDNEVLVIRTDENYFLIADSFERNEFAVKEDTFVNVSARGYDFQRTFKQNEVIHLKYSNERLSSLIDSLFVDYGDLFGKTLAAQKRKNQIRSTVDVDTSLAKTKDVSGDLQTFINKLYEAIETKDVAIVPQQPGFAYSEKSANGMMGQSVDEINKVTNGFLDQVAMAIGIPVSLLRGDMADVEKQTKNYMFFTVSPLLLKIKNEIDAKYIAKKDYLDGHCVDVRKPSYRDIFDLSTAVDKLRASGVMNGNEIRSELGLEKVDNEMLDTYVITKNYTSEETETAKGGEDE